MDCSTLFIKKIKISLLLTDKMKTMTDLNVIYIDDKNVVTTVPNQRVGDEITFVTDHLSYYGVIGKVKAITPKPDDGGNTGDNGNGTNGENGNAHTNGNSPRIDDYANLASWFSLLFVSAGGIFLFLVKRKLR